MNAHADQLHANYSVLLYEGKAPRRSRSSYRLQLGEHVRIEADHINRYCFSDGSALQEDLAAVLSAVRTADRAGPRLHGKSWARVLSLDIPVFDLQLWQSKSVSEALADALQYLTGDRWQLTFRPRKGTPKTPDQAHLLGLPAQERFFMPYSNGLDSYALASQIRHRTPTAELILINVQASRSLKKWEHLGRTVKQDLKAVQVAFHFQEPHRSEPTFRSRPLIYDLLAGYGAAMAQPARVVIPENGQGSLGGSLVPLGDEAPHRSCHPGFTSRLSRLVEALTGTRVDIEHPALFMTKGQVLADLASRDKNSALWLAGHRSCSYDARHASRDKRAFHCGVCGNCLLRRVATRWAQIDDTTSYEANNLAATTFEASFSGAPPRTLAAKRDVAFTSVRAMQRLSDLAENPNHPRVTTEVATLARALGKPVEHIGTNMKHFLQQHRMEWAQFLEACGPSSWISSLARN